MGALSGTRKFNVVGSMSLIKFTRAAQFKRVHEFIMIQLKASPYARASQFSC